MPAGMVKNVNQKLKNMEKITRITFTKKDVEKIINLFAYNNRIENYDKKKKILLYGTDIEIVLDFLEKDKETLRDNL